MTKFNQILPAAIVLSICSALAVPAHADLTAEFTGNDINAQPTPDGYYLVDVDCAFDVWNQTFAPVSVSAGAAIVIEQYSYVSGSKSLQVNLPAQTAVVGQYKFSFRGPVYPRETFHVHDTITDVTPYQTPRVLYDEVTKSFTVPPIPNGGDG